MLFTDIGSHKIVFIIYYAKTYQNSFLTDQSKSNFLIDQTKVIFWSISLLLLQSYMLTKNYPLTKSSGFSNLYD